MDERRLERLKEDLIIAAHGATEFKMDAMNAMDETNMDDNTYYVVSEVGVVMEVIIGVLPILSRMLTENKIEPSDIEEIAKVFKEVGFDKDDLNRFLSIL